MLTHLQDVLMEAVELLGLCGPSFVILFFDTSPWLIDLLMLGHLGKGHLAAGALAISYFLINWVVCEGVLTVYETLTGYSLGPEVVQRNTLDVRLITYASVPCLAVVCTVCTCAFIAARWVFEYAFPDNWNVVFKASQHVLILIPALWIMCLNRLMCKYFQTIKKLRFSLLSNAVTFGINLVGNYLLMYVVGMGFVGCSVVTVVSRSAGLAVNISFLRNLKQYDK
jgi:Na+-driven multidrug efflux pump